MAGDFESEFHGNLFWERTRLLDQLRACLEQNMPVTAIHVSKQSEVITLLRGTVEPFRDASDTLHQNMPVFLLGRTALDGQTSTLVAFGSRSAPSYVFRLVDAAEVEDRQKGYMSDSDIAYMLSKSNFDAAQSEQLAAELFGSPPIETDWHRKLGIGRLQRPDPQETDQ